MQHYNNSRNDDSQNVDLSQYDDTFADTSDDDNEYESIPDGKYQVSVDSVKIVNSKTSGNPMINWTLRIIGPRYQGRLLWRNNVIASRQNVKWLKKDLKTCGLKLQKLSDLPTYMSQLSDIKLEVTKRTKGEYENVYINKRLNYNNEPNNSDEINHGFEGNDDVPF